MSKENKAEKQTRVDLLQGTLDMLILRTLLFGPLHGHNIAHYIQQPSEDVPEGQVITQAQIEQSGATSAESTSACRFSGVISASI